MSSIFFDLTKTNMRVHLFAVIFLIPYFGLANLPSEINDIQAWNGKVVGEEGVPLHGATVMIKGTQVGTQTDSKGEFTFPNLDIGTVLVVSYTGYLQKEVKIEKWEFLQIELKESAGQLDEVVVIGYGTAKKSDLTGSITKIEAERFENQSLTQLTEMLSGTVAGFSSNQNASAAGGGSMEVRGPNSLSAGSSPMIVLDGVIYNGGIRDINPNDIESIDILKDASSAAVYGSRAASGVIHVTTKKGITGKPVIGFTSKLSTSSPTKARKGLDPEEYIKFRQDFFRTINPNSNYDFYTNPNELGSDLTIEEWRALSANPQDDDTKEWLARLKFFSIEQKNYLAGRTIDWYDEVIKQGLRQDYDLNISGGTEDLTYYWSIGYLNNKGIRVGDQFSSVRSRLNADYRMNGWLNVGINAQFSDRDESTTPASLGFYSNSPFGQMFDDEGNLMRLPHGHTNNPLLNYYRNDRLRRINGLFSNMYAEVELPFGINYRVSFQPRYEALKDLQFASTDKKVGGEPSDISEGSRDEHSHYEWMVDNILKWNKEIGIHQIDVTLLYNIEESSRWSSTQTNKNFKPNEHLSFHGLQFGDGPGISNNDYRSTGDAMMARVNYSLLNKYLFTASVRRDGYSAFGQQNPRATFPAAAFAWRISEESFFKEGFTNDLKIRVSWGENGNRDIGRYAALARISSDLWYDGSNTRIGLYNSSLANTGLRWEKTASINIGLDAAFFENKINLNVDYYDMTTKELLLNRRLPSVTGFSNITSNLGELGNKGLEITLQSSNMSNDNFHWNSGLTFSFNRNKIKKLFGDVGEYTLLGQRKEGEIPDFTNEWFPGRALDAVWDYELLGVWQINEKEEAARYGMRPGDFKAVDVDEDGSFNELYDKQFIGFTEPRYRIGLSNEFMFLKNFTASVFIRADLGHISEYSRALNSGWESNDRRSRNVGPVPYWTPENPINDYARLDVSTSGYGGGLRIFKPRSFVRIQDISIAYRIPNRMASRIKDNSFRVFMSMRNMVTFTKWPDWDPESDASPMPKTITFGLNLSL